MTCQEIYERIWTEPLQEWSTTCRDAIHRHASECPRCGPALGIVQDTTLALGRLQQPEPSRDLSAIVMARVARLPARNSRVMAEQSVMASGTSPGAISWAWILAGFTIVAAERTSAMIAGAWPWSPALFRLGGTEINPLPASGNSAVWLLAGLLMFLMGLLTRRDRTPGV